MVRINSFTRVFIDILTKSIFAGFLIALASYTYVLCAISYESYGNIIGAVIFPFALYLICELKLNLYTGKIGYLITPDDTLKNIFNKYLHPFYYYSLCIIGNIIGVLILTLLLPVNGNMVEFSNQILLNKIIDNNLLPSLFVILGKSIVCGILVHIAVHLYKKNKTYISVFLPIFIFVLLGLEHCIALFSYISISGVYKLEYIAIFTVSVIGNSIGALLTQYAFKIGNKEVN